MKLQQTVIPTARPSITQTLGIAFLDALESDVAEEGSDRILDDMVQAIEERGKPWWLPLGVVRSILDAAFPSVFVWALRRFVLGERPGTA